MRGKLGFLASDRMGKPILYDPCNLQTLPGAGWLRFFQGLVSSKRWYHSDQFLSKSWDLGTGCSETRNIGAGFYV
jgi:hypothetical protein